jgi:tetratricopeptide (TPR) repeat protein
VLQPSRSSGRGDHGDAYYWRAWNELRLGRIEQAWADVQAAQKLWVNADVSKLAGLIAYRRQQLEVAEGELQEGHRLNPDDCETTFNLGAVHLDQRKWQEAVRAHVLTAQCLETARNRLREEIDAIHSSSAAADRKSRQIATRQSEIATADRMLARSWFDTAVAYFNLSRTEEARLYAEKVASDPQYAARAEELLNRLRK